MEFEDVERKAKHGDVTTAQIRKVLDDVSEKTNGDTIIPDSTQKYLDDWLDLVRKRSTPATVERYRHSVELFVASLGDKAKKPITAVTPPDIEVFLNSRVEAGAAPKDANRGFENDQHRFPSRSHPQHHSVQPGRSSAPAT